MVSTTDAQAVDFRKYVVEWLMLHHPHDCPVCDEGGHCLLQDMTVAGGHGLRRYLGAKRTHRDQYLGPLVQHEMNRCIQCYRFSRYYQKYTGYRDLGVMGIGTRVYFGRSKPGRLERPFAGNLIDICLFICNRGRYGYPYANAADRPRQARIGDRATTVTEALDSAGGRLKGIVGQTGPQGVAVIGTTRSSLETLVALETLCRDKSWTGPVYHMEGRRAVNLKAAVGHLTEDLAVSMGAVSVADIVVVIGADPFSEAPMLALALRQVGQNGGHVTVIDPRPIGLPLDFDHWPVQTLLPVTRPGGRWINQEGRLQKSRPAHAGGESIARTGNLGHPPRIFENKIPGGVPVAAWRLAVHLAGKSDVQDHAGAEDFMAAALESIDPAWREHEADRIGQEKQVRIFNLCAANSIEDYILEITQVHGWLNYG